MHGARGDDGPFEAVRKAIWAAPPNDVIAVAADLLDRHAGGADTEVLMIDYRQTFLVRTLSTGDDVPVDNTAPGRAFASQRPVQEDGGGLAHLPLTVKGERIGILSVRLPDGGPPWLDDFAGVLARALKIADEATDRYRRLRRRTRLTLAAEMQWDLLPAPAYRASELWFAGQLEPAYAVWGDAFDWATSADRFTLTVSNGMGSGTESAELTHLAISALRNARRSGGDIVEQAELADEAVFGRHRGERLVDALLLEFELTDGRVRVIDAGSPVISRMRDGATERIAFEAQMPLGMFGDTRYVPQEFAVEPGDRLVIVSDGVHGARSPAGVLYGDAGLPQAMRATRLQDPPEAVRTMIRHYVGFHGGTEPSDDAVIVCVDWTGRDAEAGKTGPEA
ncbi:PP2C family protein-serine/threonine phosphatase [Actinomadura luteofluorescens]|uniref:Serine phosphatase RsbU (Regulator of sigma subunit) n=1 Tax=Actinomadura luteofluorescens TaxID=46163 RepID=A0A7Y9EHH6_9ACTN|nr:PP2C family protein-serine/threonine phosphatase [Actinomadura luteofluorescens]NYD47853.1 serine phosphatase RsbU (regulator of sigma subunit) [Actinomadura luteofluorescens]